MCCESNSEERSAGNPHATFCGGWGIQRMPLLPGLGPQLGSPFYPAELEIELVATTPALYSTVIHTPLSDDFFLKSRISNLPRRCTVSNGNQYQMSELRRSRRWCPRGFREGPNSIFLPDD